MNKKVLISLIVFVLVAGVVAGVLVWKSCKKTDIDLGLSLSDSETENIDTGKIESIEDLIDGEYQFGDVDISDWKEYKNDKMGFKVKIPNNWSCDKIGLHRDISKGVICMQNDNFSDYYSTPASHDFNMIMFSVVSDENNDENITDFIKRHVNQSENNHNLIIAVGGTYGFLEVHLNKIHSTFLKKDNKYWSINNSHNLGFNQDIFDGVMQSFKVIE